MAGHLDDSTVAALVDGSLDPDRLPSVQEHLDGCAECRRLVGLVAGKPEADGAGRVAIHRGSGVGRYLVLDTLGSGGMGTVYRAYDPRLDRKIALKLLRPDVYRGPRAEAAKARLLKEAQAMARLAHPHVVTVHDVGEIEDQLYIAMECVEGQNLRDWLRVGSRGMGAVLEVMSQAGAGLSAIHRAGLVHRDFKPDNVLVATDGTAHVTDFGLARSELTRDQVRSPFPAASLTPPVATETGEVLGTPLYMAPEQMQGATATALSDQFSFCVTLYEALFGRRPFFGGSLAEVELSIRQGLGPARPPSKEIPLRVWRALGRGLHADPGQRFPSMEALLAELKPRTAARRAAWLVPLVAGGVAAASLAFTGWSVRHQAPLCQGAAAHLAGVWDGPVRQRIQRAFVATGASYAAQAWERTAAGLDQYAQAWTRMRQEACEATRVRGEQSDAVLALRMQCLDRRLEEAKALTEALGAVDAKTVSHAPAAIEDLPPVAECADVDALTQAVPPPDRPSARAAVASIRHRLDQIRAALLTQNPEGQAQACAPLVQQAAAVDYPPLEAEVLLVKGLAELDTGDSTAAAKTYSRAALAAEAGRDDVALGKALVQLATGDEVSNELKQLYLARAAALDRRSGGKRLELRASLLFARGALAFSSGDYTEAKRDASEALELDEKLYGPHHLAVAYSLELLSAARVESGELEKAIELGRRALEIQQEISGPDNPSLAESYGNYGETLANAGRLKDALVYQRKSLALLQSMDKPGPFALALAWSSIGETLAKQKAFADADEAFQQALSLPVEATSRAHLEPLLHRGENQLLWGHVAEARANLLVAKALLEKAGQAKSPEMARAVKALAAAQKQ